MKFLNFNVLFLIWTSFLVVNVTCQECAISYWELPSLWYLKNYDGYDMNVLPAWRECVNGTGITVGVVDRGIQDHDDLDINRSLNGGFWMNDGTDNDLRHGTRAAGIIAARRNNFGIIGIAFGAQTADIRISRAGLSESSNAVLLNHRLDVIDVYSTSSVNAHTGFLTYPLLESQESALHIGVTQGRHGLGSVYVFGSGNRGDDMFQDSCAYDRLISNRYVIPVAGIQHNLKRLPNGEACSAMMVAALTSYPGSQYKVTTTDIDNTFTNRFYGNSAAVSMVSGAVALALSANPALGYRDIMHLLVQTSRSYFPDLKYRSYFTTNAAGHNVSSTFGFGVLDIGLLVDRSKTWINVPPVRQCTKTVNFMAAIQNTANNFLIHVTDCDVTYVEHVDVTLRVTHPNAGQIKWVLISPYGTRSTILPGRVWDLTKDMNITVLSNQMWGENSNGYWRLEPDALFRKSLERGTLESVTISIYGHRCQSLPCLSTAIQDGSWGTWTEWSPCSVTCGQGTRHRIRECRGPINGICHGTSWEGSSCNIDECLQTDNYRRQEMIDSATCPSPYLLRRNCVEECSSDNDCAFGRRCCFNGCGHTCERPFIRAQALGCPSPNSVRSVCVERCSTDIECYGTRKCCYNGCGHTCEIPTQITEESDWNQWNNWSPCSVTCGQGTQSRSRQCRSSGTWCNGQSNEMRSCYLPECQTCRERVGIQSSTCPSPRSLVSICAEQCSSDTECGESMKCCYNGCGHTCVLPRKIGVKSGTCPSQQSLPITHDEQCSVDSDCWGERKCCYNGRHHSCEIPNEATRVKCPAQETPTSTQEISTTSPEIPTSTLEIPTTNSEIPSTTLEIPTTNSEFPTTTPEIPTTTPEIPTTTLEIPTTTEISTTTIMTSTTTEIPTTTPEIPTTTTETLPMTSIPSITTVETQEPACPVDQFQCSNGQCIHMNNRCNDHFDCDDQSDELNCPRNELCPEGQYRCDNQCVGQSVNCRGSPDGEEGRQGSRSLSLFGEN